MHPKDSSENLSRESLAPLQLTGDESLLDEDAEIEPAILSDTSIRQQVVRSVIEDEDFVSAISRVSVQAGADREVVHLPIHPPFATIPEVDAFVISGAESRIRVTQKQRFGLRLEVVLSRPAAATVETVIEVIARSKQKGTACQPRREAA